MDARGSVFNRTKKNKKPYIFLTIILIFFMLIGSFVLAYLYLPFFQSDKINPTNEIQIYYMGELAPQAGYEDNGVLYLPYIFIKEHIDEDINMDDGENYVIITTNKDVFHLPLGNNEGLLNLKPYSFTYPLIKYDNNIYLPMDPLNSYYDIEIKYYSDNSLFVIHDLSQPILKGIITKDTKLRKQPRYNSSWTYEINLSSKVNIIKEIDGWYWIENDNGLVGYVNKKYVELSEIMTSLIKKEIYQPKIPIVEPIQLIWENVTKYSSIDTNDIGNIAGINVISPTWFSLQNEGLILNIADIEYMEWAHNKGYQIWPLFSNSFDPDLTHAMLSDTSLRIKVIKQLLSYIDLYQLDGINLDFENVNLDDKDRLVQFVRELTPLMHEKGRTVSIDVTFKSLSANWSLFYDRKRLSDVVDYVIVMGYDEHWAASPVAGSVSSLPWVEKGIVKMLEEVPNEKLILGVPLYTRMWTEKTDEMGKVSVSSKTYTMDMVNDWIHKNDLNVKYDKNSQQNYVELKEGLITYKIWIEDESSMKKRVDVINKYDLAGMAGWRRGFESKDFWTGISEYIKKKY